jgi:NodT family efflux transporter outer membrane factor (OMF) lipoprotein
MSRRIGFGRAGESGFFRAIASVALSALLVLSPLLAGCDLAPKYSRAPVDTPPAYKELDGWKLAEPQDGALKGKWWELFGDPELNALEEQVDVSNQNIASAAAAFLVARAMVKEARAQLFPTVTASPGVTWSRPSSTLNFVAGGSAGAGGTGGTGSKTSIGTFAEYTLPFDASYEIDLWGKLRNQVKANVYAAQASAADLANIRLTAQAEVAVDYFNLRSQDAQKKLLDDTVKAYRDSLELTRALFETGIDNEEALSQAQTQLDTTIAQDTNLGILRAQYEHAIAVLIGKPPASLSIPFKALDTNPPVIPVAVPSALLERRPDVAAGERSMAQANVQIGIARAAYFPSLTLSASLGLESSQIAQWFTWPSRFFSAGPQISETLYDGGLRRATVQQYRANYDETIANYRQDVLTAFQQVEDNLAALRILDEEYQQQDVAVKSAQNTLRLALDRYRLGLDPYLNVITAETALLSNQETEVTLRMQQMQSSVQLIEALGGGWDNSQLPSSPSMIAKP